MGRNTGGIKVMTTICFIVVNVVLSIILLNTKKTNGNIDKLFMTCLIFTFIGNVFIPSINTILSLINIFLGLKVLKRASKR